MYVVGDRAIDMLTVGTNAYLEQWSSDVRVDTINVKDPRQSLL